MDIEKKYNALKMQCQTFDEVFVLYYFFDIVDSIDKIREIITGIKKCYNDRQLSHFIFLEIILGNKYYAKVDINWELRLPLNVRNLETNHLDVKDDISLLFIPRTVIEWYEKTYGINGEISDALIYTWLSRQIEKSKFNTDSRKMIPNFYHDDDDDDDYGGKRKRRTARRYKKKSLYKKRTRRQTKTVRRMRK